MRRTNFCRVQIGAFLFAILCIAANTAGNDWPTLHGNAEHTGRSEETLQFPLALQWVVEFENERIATAAEPLVSSGSVFVQTLGDHSFQLSTDSGDLTQSWNANAANRLFRVSLDHGIKVHRDGSIVGYSWPDHRPWTAQLHVPIRQFPAVSDQQNYVTGEDLKLRCFEEGTGKLLWTSEQMFGQTARDYYPVIVRVGGKKFVVVRTNPVLNMAQQIASDRNFLAKQAGIDGSDWKKLDAWIKSPDAAGTPELIAREQDAIVHYLETNKWAQTFYVFDADTGQRAFTPPILWVGGCQGVGPPPAITKEGKAVVIYRIAYGNWNHGVAPLVALGLLNFETARIEPLRHNQGAQPPWNTFWGTADEEQNFTIAGDDLIIVHQGTLARFNLKTHDLEKIWGERDTYGGFKNPPWARNEWHGPGRGGVAISNGRIYWITGSRLLCLGPGKPAAPPTIKTIQSMESKLQPEIAPKSKNAFEKDLGLAVKEVLSKSWAPLYVEPGLAGREFFFVDSRETYTALSCAYPLLPKSEQSKVKNQLAALLQSRPPFGTNAVAPLTEGDRREYFQVPPQVLTRLGNDRPSHRFGGVYSAYLYAERCNAWPEILKARAEIESAFRDFVQTNPNFGQKPELYFNRYLASLIAFRQIVNHDALRKAIILNAHIVPRQSEPGLDTKARDLIEAATPTLIQWWRDAGTTLTNFNGSSELDRFIQKGDKLSWAVFPHRHKLAIFQDMTPEIAAIIRAEAPDAIAQVWTTFTNLAPNWHLVGEERQYHFGENFVDTPDFALAAFQTFAFLQQSGVQEILSRVDIPFCKADLYHIQKLAIALSLARPN